MVLPVPHCAALSLDARREPTGEHCRAGRIAGAPHPRGISGRAEMASARVPPAGQRAGRTRRPSGPALALPPPPHRAVHVRPGLAGRRLRPPAATRPVTPGHGHQPGRRRRPARRLGRHRGPCQPAPASRPGPRSAWSRVAAAEGAGAGGLTASDMTGFVRRACGRRSVVGRPGRRPGHRGPGRPGRLRSPGGRRRLTKTSSSIPWSSPSRTCGPARRRDGPRC